MKKSNEFPEFFIVIPGRVSEGIHSNLPKRIPKEEISEGKPEVFS